VQLLSSRLVLVFKFVILTISLLRFEILMNDLNVATYNLLQQANTNWNKDMERESMFLYIFIYQS